MEIVTQPLRAEGFARFGAVVEAPIGAARRDRVAALFNARASARPNLATVSAPAGTLPLELRQLERHPHSSQTFFPFDADRYLVVVCPDDGTGHPRVDQLAAFVGSGAQGFSYAPNVWHYAITALERGASFAVLIWEDGSEGDCEFATLTDNITVVAPCSCEELL